MCIRAVYVRRMQGYTLRHARKGTSPGADGAPRPHWRRLVDLLGSWQSAELVERWEQARKLIRDNGVTYNVHDEASGEQSSSTWAPSGSLRTIS